MSDRMLERDVACLICMVREMVATSWPNESFQWNVADQRSVLSEQMTLTVMIKVTAYLDLVSAQTRLQ